MTAVAQTGFIGNRSDEAGAEGEPIMAYIIGGLIGALLGMVLIGGAVGWVVHKLFKVPYFISDGLAMLLLAIAANFTNSSMFPPIPAGVIFAATGVFAYFILTVLRQKPDPAAIGTRIEPAMSVSQAPVAEAVVTNANDHVPVPGQGWVTLRKIVGGVLLTVLGAAGSTAMFMAFRQVFSPTYYGGSPEFSFLIGAFLLIPCIFIWRGTFR